MARVLTLTMTDPSAMKLALEEAGRIAQAGGVLAVPTESFYALSASVGRAAWQTEAIDRVCRIKGRADGKPLLVLIADASQVSSLVAAVPRAATLLMRRFWPGPLTIVLPAAAGLPDALTAGTGTVGVRLSAYPLLQAVLQRTGPLTGTSANRSGEPPARTAEEVRESLENDVEAILDGGATPAAQPSTVIDVTGPIRLLREGPITAAQIASVLAEAGLALER
ncbi:MAG: threonylcarbamoyl-AMP synthase [Nitrospirota bacterium]|nr:threonylcarbamoyl-AMP synthase [Nitrospirota bacterium]